MHMSSTSQLSDRCLLGNYGRLPLVPERGAGTWLWDAEGKKYLDFACGIAVCSLGHCPPAITAAIHAQVDKLIHCSNLYQIPGQAELAARLVDDVVGAPGKCFFCNSGAEANEALIKLARRFGHAVPQPDGTPRHEILTFTNSFHGRTMAGISATGQEKMKAGFGPLLPGFRHLPFNDAGALRGAIAPGTAAVMVEPVQGEGGIHVATAGFLGELAEICAEFQILLLMDEVQCGLGRSGDPCAWRTVMGGATLTPDAVSWAKGLGGGFPIGAVWISDRPVAPPDREQIPLSSLLPPGSHGTTFGGSPLASAVGLAVLAEIVASGLCANAAAQGKHILHQVGGWGDLAALEGLRGVGLMLGFVLDGEAVSRHPEMAGESRTPAAFVVGKLMEAGLLTAPAGAGVVRWLPPLNVTREEVDEALSIMHRVLAEISGALLPADATTTTTATES
ncbi:acetylornithine transaminase [soil metagenome]